MICGVNKIIQVMIKQTNFLSIKKDGKLESQSKALLDIRKCYTLLCIKIDPVIYS